ncbi:MAG: primase [Pseudomonadota bacterium]|jgi:DNA primase
MAGLIPQSFIDDLLARADIVDVVDKRIKLRKTGRNYQALCPFHQEKSPSFSVEPDKQFYYCFGCGAGGNAIGFIMNHDNVDFPQAVEILAAENGMEVPRETSPTADRRKSANQALLDLLARANRFYQYQLRNHPARQQAVNYLKQRGLSGEIARTFQLGFAPPGWDNLIKALGGSPAERKLLDTAGLVVKKETAEAAAAQPADDHYYDRFRHRIMFPIRDSRGQVIGFGGRVLGDDKPKYLNSPETPVFHKGSELYGLYEAKRAGGKPQRFLIVEGYMDVIALAQMGIHNAVATLGTACSEKHLTRLFRLVSEVVFCFDGDEAGRNAAWRALQTSLPLLEDGRSIRFLFLSEGEDPDTLVRKIGAEAFRQQVQQATPLEDFLFNKLSAGLDLSHQSGGARLASLFKPLLQQLPKGIFAQLLVDRLARQLGLSSDQLQRLLATVTAVETPADPGPQPPDRPAPPRPAAGPRPRKPVAPYRKPWAVKAIELLLHQPSVAAGLQQDLTPLLQAAATHGPSVEAGADPDNTRMLLELIDLVRKNPHINTYSLLGYFYGSPVGNQLTQLMKDEKITPADGIQDEFNQIIDRVLSDVQRRSEVARRMDTLRAKLGTGNDPH